MAALFALPAAGGAPASLPGPSTGEAILAAQPADVRERIRERGHIVLQEVREKGPLSGSIITAYVIFDQPIERAYGLLSQTARHGEFRPEVASIALVRATEHGPVDEQRLKILFRRYVYRVEYRLDPQRHRIEWSLDEDFDNDLAELRGLWELYELEDGQTLGRFGTSVDVGSGVPGFLQDWITRKNLPVMMKRVRLWVDSEGRYRP